MDWWEIVLIVLGIIFILFLLTSYISFRITFYSKPRSKKELEEYSFPIGDAFVPYYEQMLGWMKDLRSKNSEYVEIKSFDNITIKARYFEGKKDAPIEIMFHGYRGTSERDLCGGIRRSFEVGHNVLLVDQRASGYSGGNVITFGIKERFDVLSWINYTLNRFGNDTKIILTGISMGATTVLMSLGEKIPSNVIGVIADCGFSSPKKIILETIKQMHLPKFMYGFVKLGGLIFGGFNIDETTPLKALESSNVPVIIFHGKNDSIVPCYMSEDIYNAVKGKKRLVQMDDCDHGLCYLVNHDLYIKELDEFFNY